MSPSDAPAPNQQPGTTITPGGSSSPAPSMPPTEQPVTLPAPEEKPPAQSEPTEPAPVNTTPPEIEVPAPKDNAPGTHTWTASEFIDHEKTAGWYFMLGICAVLLAAALWWFTKDLVTPIVVGVAAIILGVYGSHKPRQVEYQVDAYGIQVGAKHFPYSDFRSFSIVPDQAFSSIVLMPLKRFAVPLTIYYPPQDEDAIVGIIGAQLPNEQKKSDAVDGLMRRIRF